MGGTPRNWDALRPTILKLHAKGWAIEALAAKAMCARQTMIEMLKKWGAIQPQVAMVRDSSHKPERNAAILEALQRGTKPAAIEADLKAQGITVTRNMIAGVRHRNAGRVPGHAVSDKSPSRAKIVRQRKQQHERHRVKVEKAAGTHVTQTVRHVRPNVYQDFPDSAPVPPSLPLSEQQGAPADAVPFEQRTGCAWPFGDTRNGPLLFCNRPRHYDNKRMRTCAYCPEHARRMKTGHAFKPMHIPAGL